jgi:energy-coupling factor transporter ATP-binding protein EcfA2
VTTATAIETPYPGLRPFREDEARYFFGQDVPLADLRDRLYQEHFVAILGLSGCGKSSLLKAGLLADIRPKQIGGPRPRWLIGNLKPGADPLQGLVEAVSDVNTQIRRQKERLSEDLSTVPVDVKGALLADGYGLARYGHEAPLSDGQDILIVVDQFEELFRYQREATTHTDKDQAALFVQLLLEASRDKECRVSVVITMRSEFLGDCALFFGLAEQVNQGTFLLPKMTRDQIEEVIVGPGEESEFEIDPHVIQELLNETEKQDDGLPLLQHALRRIHSHWQRRGAIGPISVSDFHAFETSPPEGTLLIKHHLDDHLNSIYKSFDKDRQKATELLFRLLSERDSRGRVTRRPLRFPEIVKSIGKGRERALRDIIEAFRDEGDGRTFLTPGWGEPFETEFVDISHECLLRRWDRLRKWIDYEQHDAEQFCRLADDADKADLHAWRSRQPRKPIEGVGLENLLEWRKKASLVSEGWALRYQGAEISELGRLARSYGPAQGYLEWSADEARRRKEKEEADAEQRIRAEEQLQRFKVEARVAALEVEARLAAEEARRADLAKQQAETEAQLANQRAEIEAQRTRNRLRYASMLILLLLVMAAAIGLWNRSQQAESRAAADRELKTNAESLSRLAKERANEATANAKEQERLKNEQIATADELRRKSADLESSNRNLTQTSDALKRAYADLQKATVDLKAAQEAELKSAKERAELVARAAEERASSERALQKRREQASDWLATVVETSQAFSDSYHFPPSLLGPGRTDAVLRALRALEEDTAKLDPEIREEAEHFALYRVRKAGLQALTDSLVPALTVRELQSGVGEAACYAEDTKSGLLSLLQSGRLRRGDSSRTDLFFSSRRVGNSFVNLITKGFLQLTRNALDVRSDPPPALALSDDCQAIVMGSEAGSIDWYDTQQSGFMLPRGTFRPHPGRVTMLRLSPDSRYVVAAFADRGWAVWERTTGKLIVDEANDKVPISSAAFSANGQWLAVVNSIAQAFRFDLKASSPRGTTKAAVACCTPLVGQARQQLDVSNTGMVASFGAGSAAVSYGERYDRTGGSALRAIRLSPDGSFIATGRDDGSVDVWRVGGVGELPTHLPDQSRPSSPVSALSWSKSGHYLTVLHDIGLVRVWRVTNDSRHPAVPAPQTVRELLRELEAETIKDQPRDTRALLDKVRRLSPQSAR